MARAGFRIGVVGATGSLGGEVLAALEPALGRAVPFTMGERRPGDPSSLVAAPDEAQRVLGWRATRSDLLTIARDAVASYDLHHGAP